jgi:hypothetical protein
MGLFGVKRAAPRVWPISGRAPILGGLMAGGEAAEAGGLAAGGVVQGEEDGGHSAGPGSLVDATPDGLVRGDVAEGHEAVAYDGLADEAVSGADGHAGTVRARRAVPAQTSCSQVADRLRPQS